MGSRLLNKVLALLFVTLSARCLGVAGFGLISFAAAFTSIFAVLGDMGVSQLGVRELARQHSLTDRYLANVLGLKVLLVSAMAALTLATAGVMGYRGRELLVLAVVTGAAALDAYSQAGRSVFFAHERAGLVSAAEVIKNVAQLAGGALAALWAASTLGFALPYLAAALFSAGYIFVVLARRFVRLRMEFDRAFWKDLMRTALPLGLTGIFAQVFFRIDVVMLSLMKSHQAVGLYSAAYRLTEANLLMSNAVLMSTFPVMAVSYSTSAQRFNEVYRHAFRALLLLALPLAAIETVLGPQIIGFIYGPQYAASVLPFQVLTWAAAAMFLSSLSSTLLVAANRQRVNLHFTMVMVAANVALNLVLIPRFSHAGAAAATLATEVLGFCLGLGYLYRRGYLVPVVRLSTRPVAIAAGVSAAGFLLRAGQVHVIVAGLLLVALAAALIYFWGLEVGDRELLGKTLAMRQRA